MITYLFCNSPFFFVHYDNCAINNLWKKIYGYYHRIIKLEDSDIYISDIKIKGTQKIITLDTQLPSTFIHSMSSECIHSEGFWIHWGILISQWANRLFVSKVMTWLHYVIVYQSKFTIPVVKAGTKVKSIRQTNSIT